MWARVHKIDRVRPQPGGGAIVLIEDERTAVQMQRVPSLSALVAIARVLAGRRTLDAKFGGKGEIRYATNATLPTFLSDAIVRAGASVTDRTGDPVKLPAQPASSSATIDVAFSELAHYVKGHIAAPELSVALAKAEQQRRSAPIDREASPEKYWTAVLELAALAGELSRNKGGRWVETRDLPLPFALKFPDGGVAHPTTVAQRIVEGADDTNATPP